jgi:hypothetical protein
MGVGYVSNFIYICCNICIISGVSMSKDFEKPFVDTSEQSSDRSTDCEPKDNKVNPMPKTEPTPNIDRNRPSKSNSKSWCIVFLLVFFVGMIVGSAIMFILLSHPPNIVAFNVTQQNVSQCQLVTLSWNVQNSDDIRIDPDIGSVLPSGSESILASKTTDYTLTAKNSFGLRSSSATRKVYVEQHIIDSMSKISDWIAFSQKDLLPERTLVDGHMGKAIRINYDLSKTYSQGIYNQVISSKLLGTNGVKFYYEGSPNPKKIEVKLEDNSGNNFVAWVNKSPSPENWSLFEEKYAGFTWQYGNLLEREFHVNNISKLTIAITRDKGSEPSKGWLTIDEISGDVCE